jgi:uncharacterized membrane protein
MKRREKFLHWAFEIGIWFKGLDGMLEMLGGILFLAVSRAVLNHIVITLTQHELNEDPGDWFANMARHASNHLSHGTKIWGGLYLLGHGAVKLFLAINILRGKMWAYPSAIVVIAIFILIQGAKLGLHFSFPLLIATAIDIVIVLLIWREYRRAKRTGKVKP